MDLHKTDSEFMERFEQFAFDEVVNEKGQQLPEHTRYLAILATLIGCGGLDAYKEMLPKALDNGMTPIEVKEIVYQATDYLGYGRILAFLHATNDILSERGVELPLEGQATTGSDNRLEKGIEAQAEIFGAHMREAWKGLDLAQRELITFCFLMAQGGCEPQLIAHSKGNMNMGNDKAFLEKVVSQCLPYIGYPRSLNAITCINKATEE